MSQSHFNKTVVRRDPKNDPSQKIADDVESFLAKGGRIEHIKPGYARYPLKHITDDEGVNPARGVAGRKGSPGGAP